MLSAMVKEAVANAKGEMRKKKQSKRVLALLEDQLQDPADSRPFVYAGYVSGAYFDQTGAPDRTAFELPEEGTLPSTQDLSWNELLDSSVERVAGFLESVVTLDASPDAALREMQITIASLLVG